MTTTFTARPASDETYELGEGPLWDPGRQRLLWVDIEGGRVFAGRLDDGRVTTTETWQFDDLACAVAVAEDGELLVATRGGVVRVGPDGSRTEIAHVLRHGLGKSRLNDGAVDPQGRYLVGSMALDDRRGDQMLIRVDDRVVLDADLTLSNGLAWSPDGGTLYSIDSIPGVVYARDYPDGQRRAAFTISDGLPDGLCTDRDGNLWIAIHERGRVECRTPAGDLLATVEIGSPKTTSAAFAGPALDTLVITSAAGPLYTARVGVTGLNTPYWKP